ncbi:AAA family ATPase [Halobacillus sp. A1]|uniref:AAA family ATPase n=1 Tax=Halobacillus sp. A1 TaxID=2880262 RepID=UPI0020A68DE7|nr:AAA family ATPase [Halobacillus sp. A1]MCP3033590.1 AAA family ATPase [Halobacillus sp. A1]
MINEITLRNVATYDNKGVEIKGLEKVNYFYGSNGSGKTTISEVLRNIDEFPDCYITQPEPDHKVFVYNRNFVEENFRQNEHIKGIFTLGKDQKETMEQIKENKDELVKHREKISDLNEGIESKEDERNSNRNIFKEECWGIKDKYTSYFKEAFTGYNNSKKNLMKKFIAEADNKNELKEFIDLVQRREALFERTLVKVDTIPLMQSTIEFQDISILNTRIIGADDVDISNLINKLSISDWVLQGHDHMHNTDGICPFCQQGLPDDLDAKLHSYFDQTYSEQINRLKSFSENYEAYKEDLISRIKDFINKSHEYIDNKMIQDTFLLIEAKIKENMNLIKSKLNEPSKVITLQDISKNLTDINVEIKKANESITENNDLVTNAKEAKQVLIGDIWRYLIEQNKENYSRYKSKDDQLDKEINGRKTGRKNKEKHKKKLEEEVSQLQKQVTNIEHSVNEINKRLRAFGFTNFKLATANEKGHYKIVRGNGEDVENTLSEGEKTFITFLYFYNLLKGSTDREEVTTNKIVVLDDPISSLDSNILFIVSNLIREIIEEVKSETGETRQLILLTHNIYFHKEVSFNRHNQTLSNESFWIVRKTDNNSYVQQYNDNPIKSSYELLWNELILLNNQSLITTQNVMRRILENYFTFFGGVNLTDIVNKFDDEEKSICRSLLTWLHDGSHHINEDLFVERSTDIVARYLEVFKQIFYRMGHGSHYEMMMKNIEHKERDGIHDDISNEEIAIGSKEAASTVEQRD